MSRQFLRVATVTITLLALTMLAAGCAEQHKHPGTGRLSVELGIGAAKTIWPGGWVDSIGDFRVAVFAETADPREDQPLYDVTLSPEDFGEPVTFHEVVEGSYQVFVAGHCGTSEYCRADDMIALGQADDLVVVLPDQTVTASIVVGPFLSGVDTGEIEVTLSWPNVEEIEVSRVEVFQRGLAESWPPVPTEVFEGADLTGQSVLFADGAAVSGSHMLRFLLYTADNHLTSSAIEVVNVYSNYMTAGAIVLTEDDFTFLEPVDGYDLNLTIYGHDTNGETLYIAYGGNGWDLDAAPEWFLDPSLAPEWSINIPEASDEDGLLEFTILFEEREFTACMTFSTWDLINATVSGSGALADCIITVDCTGVEGLLSIDVLMDVDEEEITAECVVPPGKGSLEVNMSLLDPTAEIAEPLAIECVMDEGLLLCEATHGGVFVDPEYAWYLNGARLAEVDGDSASFSAADLIPGDRLALVVREHNFAESAQLTVTSELLGL